MVNTIDKKSHKDIILNHLKQGKSLTPLHALNNFGCFRLASRINELKNEGHIIINETVKSKGKSWAKYLLIGGGIKIEKE